MEVKVRTKKKRIVRYKKPLNINIGMIILTLVFLYLGINCIIYLSRDKISIYEVTKGQSEEIAGIATTGIALRTENVTNAPASGYINYYIKEGKIIMEQFKKQKGVGKKLLIDEINLEAQDIILDDDVLI